MMHDPSPQSQQLLAPCIIETGTIVNKQDMRRVLSDLSRVRYTYSQDGFSTCEGEGCVLDVFADPRQSTLIANQAIYINVCSFDYLELSRTEEQETCFDLIQEDRHLSLIPLSTPVQDQLAHHLNLATLETLVAEVLAARLDAHFDDEEHFLF